MGKCESLKPSYIATSDPSSSVSIHDQPVISDSMPESGRIHLQSELLECLEQQSVPSDVSINVCFTLRDGNVEAGSVIDEVEEYYGQLGLDLLRSIISAAESPETPVIGMIYLLLLLHCVYMLTPEGTENGTTITLYRNSIILEYHGLNQAELHSVRSTLAWLCLLQRNPNMNGIFISRGSWTNGSFHLEPLVHVKWKRCCWSNMLVYGIVADLGNETPRRPLLKTKPSVMLYLAGFLDPHIVDGGYLFSGIYSALVPVARREDNAILWHFESKEPRGEMLDVTRMQCLKRNWLRVSDVESLMDKEAYVGWSASGGLCLGTDMHFYQTTWASRVGNPTM